MEDHVSKQLKDAFGTKTVYEILEVTTKATLDEIKKSYKKLALKFHPDKGGSAEHFKALSVAHSILSDPEKRKLYDQTGNVEDEETSQDFDHWYEYFRNLFPKVTITKIEEFGKKYKGSEEERGDVIREYENHSGDLHKIMDSVMFAESDQFQRICEIIDNAIADKTIKSTAKYTKTRQAIEKQQSNPNAKKRKSAAAEEAESSLAQLIQAKNASRGGASSQSAMEDIFAKYGGEKGKKGKGLEEPSDEVFAAVQARITKKSDSSEKEDGTTTATSSSKSKKSKK